MNENFKFIRKFSQKSKSLLYVFFSEILQAFSPIFTKNEKKKKNEKKDFVLITCNIFFIIHGRVLNL